MDIYILLYSYSVITERIRSVLRLWPHRPLVRQLLQLQKACRLTRLHRRLVVPKTVQRIEVYVAHDMIV